MKSFHIKCIYFFSLHLIFLCKAYGAPLAAADTIFSIPSDNGLHYVLAASEKEKMLALYEVKEDKLIEKHKREIKQKAHQGTSLNGDIYIAYGSSLTQQSAPIQLIRYNNTLSEEELIFMKITGRTQVSGLQPYKNNLYITYFKDTYNTELVKLRKQDKEWKDDVLYSKRMAIYIDLTNESTFLVGRPYGDAIGKDGDAYFVKGKKEIPLDTLRGASAVHQVDIDGDKHVDFFVADGWHQNYGKIAEARISLFDYEATSNSYKKTVIITDPQQFRFEQISSFKHNDTYYLLARGNKKLWLLKRTAKGEYEKTDLATRENPKLGFEGRILGVQGNDLYIAILNKSLGIIKHGI